MTANPILLQKKYVRVVTTFAEKMGISIDKALGIFYHSEVYQLMHDGVSDMHCMSEGYLAEELEIEWNNLKNKNGALVGHGIQAGPCSNS